MKSEKKEQTIEELFDSAAALWVFFTKNAGLDTVFYDPEILHGNGVYPGLYEQLHLNAQEKNAGSALRKAGTTVEAFVLAFFGTLQPYAQMMSGICAFFERHMVKGTDKQLKIVFDFSKINGKELEFDLNSFRSTVASFEKVQRIVEYFQLSANDYYTLIEQFADDYMGESTDPQVIEWIRSYRDGRLMTTAGLAWPLTGNAGLDSQLARLRNIWSGFVNACLAAGLSHDNYREFWQRNADAINGHLIHELAFKTSDYWPATFINCLFHTLEGFGKLASADASAAYQDMAEKVAFFLDERTVSRQEEADLINELNDLLQLPIWNKRHELYAAWILALTDEVMAGYPKYELNADQGILSLKFQPTLLATFGSADGPIELWSEVRSPLEEPEGKGRTNNIQPDYTFYQGAGHLPDKGIAVVEVKQYRKPSRSNFQAALNDYARALPNANVFLVNYGAVPETLALLYEKRSALYGQVKPGHAAAQDFKRELAGTLPLKSLPEPVSPISYLTFLDAMILAAPIDVLYVDVTVSLNHESYKTYVRTLLQWLLPHGEVRNLAAVDTGIKKNWPQPGISDIEELLALPFDGFTDFGSSIEYDKNVLVVTDQEGIEILRMLPLDKVMVIHYKKEEAPEFLTPKMF
ncbi:hypothetical protein [Mucilaginibacter sp.]